jgi:hypothetical protein
MPAGIAVKHILLARVRCHAYDGHLQSQFISDMLGTSIAIHTWHLNIEQYDIEHLIFQNVQGFDSGHGISKFKL